MSVAERGSRARETYAPTAVDTENVVVNDDREREEVEHVREVGPDVRGAVLADAFRVEAVGLWWRSATASRCARALVTRLTWVTARDSWLPRMSWTRSG